MEVFAMAHVTPVPCAHIAAYYNMRWEAHKCLAWQALRVGYYQWANGLIDAGFNNLYDPA